MPTANQITHRERRANARHKRNIAKGIPRKPQGTNLQPSPKSDPHFWSRQLRGSNRAE